MDAPNDLEDRLRSLLEQGRKIEAIKVYREATGAGLAEAKEEVEALERGTNPPADHLSFELELFSLLARGRKIEAIKLYREKTGVGLKDANDEIEALARKHGIKGTGCLGLLAVVFLLLGSLAVFGK